MEEFFNDATLLKTFTVQIMMLLELLLKKMLLIFILFYKTYDDQARKNLVVF